MPSPDELKPFPTALNIQYVGHTASVLSLCVSPTGQYLASGDKDGVFIIWEVMTSRKLMTKQFAAPVSTMDWSKRNMIILGTGSDAYIINWKFPRNDYQINELAIEEAKEARANAKNPEANWTFFEPGSE